MRLRNITGSREVISSSPYVIKEEMQRECAGRWREIFGNQAPVRIEAGMGKGRFLYTMARLNPGINYVGIEKYSSVLLRALQKMEAEPLENIRFIRMDAENICEMFDHEEVAQIYLNFSDPWPKDRHAKRRLTSHQFFERYQQILASNGTVEFKTDNTALFDFSLEEVKEAGWKLDAFTRNLHQDNTMMEGNVMTEYEERFSKMGNPIYKLIASFPQK